MDSQKKRKRKRSCNHKIGNSKSPFAITTSPNFFTNSYFKLKSTFHNSFYKCILTLRSQIALPPRGEISKPQLHASLCMGHRASVYILA